MSDMHTDIFQITVFYTLSVSENNISPDLFILSVGDKLRDELFF